MKGRLVGLVIWRWLADRIVPPSTLTYEPAVRYVGTGRLLRRLLENRALT